MKLDADGRAVLWDMDGTLVDTAELHFAAWRQLMQELNRPFTRADFAATFGLRNPESSSSSSARATSTRGRSPRWATARKRFTARPPGRA